MKIYFVIYSILWKKKKMEITWCKVWCIWLMRQTDQPKSNIFLVFLVECDLALLWRSTTFQPLMSVGCYLGSFHVYVATVDRQWFKDSKGIIPRWFHHKHNINFLAWSSALGAGCRYSFLSFFCIDHYHKDPFFVPCNVILENRGIFLPFLSQWILYLHYTSHKE